MVLHRRCFSPGRRWLFLVQRPQRRRDQSERLSHLAFRSGELRGRVVKAFLVLRPGLEPGEQLRSDIQEFAKSKMAGYKCPRRIEFLETLPKTTSGKIKRKELRERE